MIPYPLQTVKKHQAELRREAERNRLSKSTNSRKPIVIGWKMSIATVFAAGVILLLEFLG